MSADAKADGGQAYDSDNDFEKPKDGITSSFLI